MSFLNVKEYVREVTHRTDLSDDLFDKWNDAAAGMLNNDLLLNDYIFTQQFTLTNNQFYVDINSGEILELHYLDSEGQKIPLVATTYQLARRYENEEGDPVYYTMLGDRVLVAPYNPSDPPTIGVTYRGAITQFSNDADTNSLFVTRPHMYYYLFLKFAYEYAKDFDSADRYNALYLAEVDKHNRRETYIDAGNASQMQGASQWV